MEETIWPRGAKAELARRVGISRQYLNDFVSRRRRPAPPALAERLEKAAAEMGMYIPKEAWVFNRRTNNPYFKEKDRCDV